MGENTKIEWAHHTFNPWIGCAKVSPGCAHCDAEQLMDLRYGKVEWGPNGTRQRTSEANWREPIKWDRQAAKEGTRYRVFCASLADVFESREELRPWRKDLWSLIEQCPNLDWLLLTKRPELVRLMAPIEWVSDDWPANVWMGTSVENQETADERIPHLLTIPARVRFLSMEPLLGPVDLGQWIGYSQYPKGEIVTHHSGISWVIVGGESGKSARPMHPDWVRSLLRQCFKAKDSLGWPAFFFKQWGKWLPFDQVTTSEQREAVSRTTREGQQSYFGARLSIGTQGLKTAATPGIDPVQINRVGKSLAGRILDGRTWDEVPEVSHAPRV